MTDQMRGRDAELATVLAALDATQAGENRVLTVESPTGLGRSRLLREAVAEATRSGIATLTTTGLGGSPSALLVTAPPGGRPGQRFTGGEIRWLEIAPSDEIVTLITTTARDRAVLVAIDDLHLASESALNELPLLITLLRDAPVCWLLACRSDHGSPAVEQVLSTLWSRSERVELAPLPESVIIEIAADRLSEPPSPALRAQLTSAGGNPLFAMTLLEGYLEADLVASATGSPDRAPDTLPRRAHRSVQRVIGQLSLPCQQLLQVAAVLGPEFALGDVARMLGDTTTGALLPAVDEALRAGVLVCRGERLRFQHPIVLRTILELLPRPVRLALCQDAERIQLGRRALRGSGSATGLPAEPASPGPAYRGSTELAAPGNPGTGVPATVDDYVRDGDIPAAINRIRTALDEPVAPAVAAALTCRLAALLIHDGRAGEAAAAARRVHELSALSPEIQDEAESCELLALSLYDPAAAEQRASLVDRGRRNRPRARTTATVVLGNVAWNRGELATGIRHSTDAVEGLDQDIPVSLHLHARLCLARKLLNTGDTWAAQEQIQRSQAELERAPFPTETAAPQLAQARVHTQSGQLTHARESAQRALALARQNGHRLLLPLIHTVLAKVALWSGDMLSASKHVEDCRLELERGSRPLWSSQYDWVRLLLVAEQSGARPAIDLLRGELAGMLTDTGLLVEEPGAAAWLIRLAHDVGDSQLAKRVLLSTETLARNNPEFSVLRSAAEHARGLHDADPATLEAAAAGHREPWARACAAEDLGTLLASKVGPKAPAIAQLRRALWVFSDSGAERDVARVRRKLRELGAKHISAQPEAQEGWASLTDLERTIAYLVSQSFTNQQIAHRVFLSPHTVNYHLRRIFRKLRINSRIELAKLTQANQGQH